MGCLDLHSSRIPEDSCHKTALFIVETGKNIPLHLVILGAYLLCVLN